MEYNATITYDTRDQKAAGELLDALAEFHPAATADPLGYVQAIITVQAETLAQATAVALAVGGPALDADVVGVDVTPTERFDSLGDAGDIGGLLSVAEAATILGVSPQAVRERLERGTIPGRKIGKTWAVGGVYARLVGADGEEVARLHAVRGQPITHDGVTFHPTGGYHSVGGSAPIHTYTTVKP